MLFLTGFEKIKSINEWEVLKMETQQQKTTLLSANKIIALQASQCKSKTLNFQFIGNNNIHSHNKLLNGKLRRYAAPLPLAKR